MCIYTCVYICMHTYIYGWLSGCGFRRLVLGSRGWFQIDVSGVLGLRAVGSAPALRSLAPATSSFLGTSPM